MLLENELIVDEPSDYINVIGMENNNLETDIGPEDYNEMAKIAESINLD